MAKGGMRGEGGHTWHRGACVVKGGHVWSKGVHGKGGGGMCGKVGGCAWWRGCAWQTGACVVKGGVCGIWQDMINERMVCILPECILVWFVNTLRKCNLGIKPKRVEISTCFYRSWTVNSKFLWNLCQIPIISSLKCTVNSNTVTSKFH